VAKDPVHVHDSKRRSFNLMGLDHDDSRIATSGRDFRLTDVAGNVVKGVLS